jgi:DNA-binding GntR family transcriptional regulator
MPPTPKQARPAIRLSSRAVADRIEKRIRAGEFGEHGRLPSTPDLAKQYGVSPGSARRARRELELRGVVRVVSGKGTFTLPPAEL